MKQLASLLLRLSMAIAELGYYLMTSCVMAQSTALNSVSLTDPTVPLHSVKIPQQVQLEYNAILNMVNKHTLDNNKSRLAIIIMFLL